jgi:hypothetical protein
MPFDLNTIKEYLVGLGFKIDTASYAKFEQTLKNISKLAEEHSSKMGTYFVRGAATVVTALASITAATIALMEKTATADLNYQVFAMRMFMATDQARRLKMALDALGRPLEEVMWVPELRERLKELMGIEKMIGGPDVEKNLRYVRDITFEFTKLRMEMQLGARFLTSFIMQGLKRAGIDPLEWMRKLNTYIQSNLPMWTERISDFLMKILRVVKEIWPEIKEILTDWYKLQESIGNLFFKLFGLSTSEGKANFIAFLKEGLTFLSTFAKTAIIAAHAISLILTGNYSEAAERLSHMMDEIEKGALKMGAIEEKRKGSVGEIRAKEGRAEPSTLGRALEAGIPILRFLPGVTKFLSGISSIREAIAAQESGGNYYAYNPSGARGKYQIMPGTWAQWAPKAGLPANAPMTPGNQEQVASFMFSHYMKKFGDERLVAAAWYAGEGYAESLQRGKPLYDPWRRQGKGGMYPSVEEYILKTAGRYYPSSNVTEGDFNVNVTVHGGNPEEVKRAILDAAEEERRRRSSRQIRLMSSVGGG